MADSEVDHVKAAAREAVSLYSATAGTFYKLVEVKSAMTQVVAGIKYRLELLVSKSETRFLAKVDILRRVDGSWELLNWKEE